MYQFLNIFNLTKAFTIFLAIFQILLPTSANSFEYEVGLDFPKQFPNGIINFGSLTSLSQCGLISEVVFNLTQTQNERFTLGLNVED